MCFEGLLCAWCSVTCGALGDVYVKKRAIRCWWWQRSWGLILFSGPVLIALYGIVRFNVRRILSAEETEAWMWVTGLAGVEPGCGPSCLTAESALFPLTLLCVWRETGIRPSCMAFTFNSKESRGHERLREEPHSDVENESWEGAGSLSENWDY